MAGRANVLAMDNCRKVRNRNNKSVRASGRKQVAPDNPWWSVWEWVAIYHANSTWIGGPRGSLRNLFILHHWMTVVAMTSFRFLSVCLGGCTGPCPSCFTVDSHPWGHVAWAPGCSCSLFHWQNKTPKKCSETQNIAFEIAPSLKNTCCFRAEKIRCHAGVSCECLPRLNATWPYPSKYLSTYLSTLSLSDIRLSQSETGVRAEPLSCAKTPLCLKLING